MFKLHTSLYKVVWPQVLYKMTDRFFILHLETRLLSPICHSYHSLAVTELSYSAFHLYELE